MPAPKENRLPNSQVVFLTDENVKTNEKKEDKSAAFLFWHKLSNLFSGLIDFILYIFYLVGQATIGFFSLIIKFPGYFLSRLKSLVKKVLFLLELIGRSTIFVFGTILLVAKKLFEKSGLIKKAKKKTAVEKSYNRFFKKVKKNVFYQNAGRLLSLRLFIPRWLRYVTVSALFIIVISGTFLYLSFLKDLPKVTDLVNKPLPAASRIIDRNGMLLYVAYDGKTNRLPIPLSQIPKYVKEATIATEDKNFYQHHGLSIRGILRAFINNLNKKPIQGGSTITQQLVKLCLLKNSDRTIPRKIKEAYLSVLTELFYKKDQILEMYLNNAPYGGTAYGIEAAANKYFFKKTNELTLGEAALLASLPSAPTLNSPYLLKNKSLYKKNQRLVLSAMVEKKFITPKEAQDAAKEELSFYSIENRIQAPHFVFWLLDNLESKYGKEMVQEGGLVIQTTLDLPTQLTAERIVKEHVEEDEERYWISNGAALVTEPKTGRILAMVGSRSYFDDQHEGKVNVVVSKRQPGSSIKLVNYAYALSQGKFTPSSIIQDSPVTYRNAWESYTPVNYDGKYRGNVSLRQAFAMSLNVPAVKVLNTYGPKKMLELGIKMGIESWKDLKGYGLSLTLGAGEVKMTELATAYGVMPNLGVKKPLTGIERILGPNNELIENRQPINNQGILAKLNVPKAQAASPEQVIPETTAYQINNILSDNDARAPIFGYHSQLVIPGHKVAVKTGTTNEIRDNWTIGYTPNFLVATWVGNNDNQRMNPHLASGVTGAAPIWNDLMASLLTDRPEGVFATPSGMIKIKICAAGGLLPCPRCPKVIEEYFVPGTEPKTKCYFPSAEDCKAKREQMTAENKSPDEINRATVNCPAETPK